MDAETNANKAPSQAQLAAVKVFPLIVQFKKDAIANVDTALSWEQLTASDVNFALVRPLVFKYARLKNPSSPFAALVVRAHFLSLADDDMAHSAIMLARAHLCELLAMKLLATFVSDKILTVAVLSTSWSPLAGAPDSVLADVKGALGGDGGEKMDPQNALEMAIATRAKRFIASPVVQTVVNELYRGDVVFSMASHHSVLADNYKPRAIELYDAANHPFLNHYRLRVPRYGAILDFLNYALLLLTFLFCLVDRDNAHIRVSEIIFCVFAVSFALEEYTAQKEHGWSVYIANMWNVFDTAFIVVFLAYVVTRSYGLSTVNEWYSELGFDILSCGACILFPRLAFFAISNNIVVIALRGMAVEFGLFMGIAAICFSGLGFTLWRLANGAWSARSILWLMVQIWFGNTYLSFQQAESFHPFFGPILMTFFAALSNTLLLTILISILSNTFARIQQNATQEHLFQFTIATIEGVKSDALFSYQPPFNLLAFLILWPSSLILSPRRLHTLNVFLIKLTSFPTLIIIAVYERHIRFRASLRLPAAGERMLYGTLPRELQASFLVDALMGTAAADVYDAIFDVDAGSDVDLWSDEEEDVRSDPGAPSGSGRKDTNGGNVPARRFLASNENINQRARVQSAVSPQRLPPHSPERGRASMGTSPVASPRKPRFPRLSIDGVSIGSKDTVAPSPLARLYGVGGRRGADAAPLAPMAEQERVDVKELRKVREELKDVQDRQARIEDLLMVLTRGMRNEK